MKRLLAFVAVLGLAGCHTASRAEKLDAKGLHEKKADRAIDDFTQAIDLEPHRAEFWLHRGDARARQGDQDGAIADYGESLRREESARAHLHRARARRQKRLYDLALADVNAAVELDPEFKDAADRERTRIRQAMGDRSRHDDEDPDRD